MKRKLPTTLTTVTTFSKILAVFIFFIFIFSAFQEGMEYQRKIDSIKQMPVVTLMPTQSPQEAQTLVISDTDNGKTEQVHQGDRIVVQLKDTLNWNINISPGNILQASPDGVFYMHPTQGRYKAVNTGTLKLSGTGKEGCSAGSGMMCAEYLLSFQTTIIVR